MSVWEKNLEAVRKKDEELAEKVQKFYESADKGTRNYVLEQARDGSDILGIIADERKVMLNSTYRPKDEAVKYAGKIQYTENSIILFFGMGNGIILSEILKKLNEDAKVLIYEPSAELFCFVLEQFDVAEIIDNKRIGLFVEGVNEDILSNNLTFALNNTNVGVTVMEVHPKYSELFPTEYEKAKKIFKDCRTSALTNLRTVIERSRLMTQNAIANIPYLLRSKISTDLVGKFPDDMPAIIVSGGPSLEKNYQVLHQAKGKALIIAMDRTVRFLLDHDIVPDLCCSLDFNKNPALFQDERIKDIPFIYIPDLSRWVMDIVNGNKLIYGTGDFKFYDWLIEKYGKETMILPLGGSVATFAFGFARQMRMKRCILIGQDLALKDGVIYAGGWQTGRPEDENDYIEVPGNVEETVTTRGDFYVYLLWFNQAVKEAEGEMEVINATEGGAKIEGAKVMTLQEAVDTYCVKEYDVAGFFDKETTIFPKEKYKEVYEDLEKKLLEIKALKKKAKDASDLAGRCKTLIERNDSGKEFKDKNKKLAAITKIFDEDVAASLVNKYVENLMLEKDMDLYVTEDDDKAEMIRLYSKLEYDYDVIYQNIDNLIAEYEAMLIRVKEELHIED